MPAPSALWAIAVLGVVCTAAGLVVFFQLIAEAGPSRASVGGLFLLLGLFTQPVAFIVAGEMAIAYFLGHAPHGFWPVLNQGHPAIMFCFVWLYLSAAGSGPWSLDAKRGR